MKITKVNTICIKGQTGRPQIIVKVDTDVGIYGLGEAGVPNWGKSVIEAIKHLSELVIGEDPFETEKLWQSMFRRGFFPADRVYSSAISALDIAFWDIKGKATGLPVYKLLGGPLRDKIVCYTHCEDAKNTDKLIQSCIKKVEQGWKFLRWSQPVTGYENSEGIQVLEPLESIDLVESQANQVRKTVGKEIQICLDVHTRLDMAHSITLFKILEPYRLFFIEDPLRSESSASYRTLAKHATTPIAAGEQWVGKWAFREVIEEELIQYARIDLCIVGGLTEALKIAHWCEAHYIDIVPHNPWGPISSAVCAALCMACTNVGVLEMPEIPGNLDKDIFPVQLQWERGYVIPQDIPGLGVDIDMDIAEKYRTVPNSWHPHLVRNDGSLTNW